MALGVLASASLCGQTLEDLVDRFNEDIGTRIEATTVIGADYGSSGGNFNFWGNRGVDGDISFFRFGGMGDIGEDRPKQIGNSIVHWAPRLQGSLGYMENTRDYKSGLLAGDESTTDTFGISFGGGGRFWFTKHLSLAPTFSGMYGYADNDYDAGSPFSRTNYAIMERLGLINYSANFWGVRPGVDLQYAFNWGRTVFSISSDYGFYHTESFNSTSDLLQVRGNSGTWKNMLDIDIPLGVRLFGRELHTGGFLSRTEFFGDLEQGTKSDYYYEAHGRLVLDILGDLWKVKWIGIGGSWIWAESFNGWSIGADFSFKF